MPRIGIDLAWLAGLFEGEGCITLNTARHRTPSLHITSTDVDVLFKAQRIAGVGQIHGPYRQKHYKPHYKDAYRWDVNKGVHSIGLLMTLYPMLGARRQARAREAILRWRGVWDRPECMPNRGD